jgi:UDP-glucuronate 4-epimerase
MQTSYTLVTGAAGFIGSKVAEELLNRGDNVVAIDCFLPNLYSNEIKLQRWDVLKSDSLVKIKFDLRTDDFSQLSKYNIKSVFNEAAMPGLVADWSNFAPYYDCNLSGLNRLLEYSRTLELDSFVQASTSSVYGKNAVGDEEQDLKPTSPYGVSKLAAEKLLLAYQDWFGIPVKILRYFSVYGPHQRPDMAYSKLIRALVNNEAFTVYGDGEQRRSNTYIDDVVNATILAERLAPNGSVINICGDETISLNEAISILEKHTGKTLIRQNAPGRTGDQRDTSGFNDKAKKILGWNTSVRFGDGLKSQVEAYLSRV